MEVPIASRGQKSVGCVQCEPTNPSNVHLARCTWGWVSYLFTNHSILHVFHAKKCRADVFLDAVEKPDVAKELIKLQKKNLPSENYMFLKMIWTEKCKKKKYLIIIETNVLRRPIFKNIIWHFFIWIEANMAKT